MLICMRNSKNQSPRTKVQQSSRLIWNLVLGIWFFRLQVISRIGDDAGEGAGGDGQRAGEVNARFPVTHAAGEVAVGRADAAQGSIEPAKRVARPTQACGTARLPQFGAGR